MNGLHEIFLFQIGVNGGLCGLQYEVLGAEFCVMLAAPSPAAGPSKVLVNAL